MLYFKIILILSNKFTYMMSVSDPCHNPDKCNNHGRCAINADDDGYECSCDEGYTGTDCENGKQFYI